MVFKRRDSRTPLQIVRETIYPRGGWGRALSYMWHRVRRLPDPPHRIARGIFAGVFVSFTPFVGIHIFIAGILSLLVRANPFAAMITTFIGNPLTFPLIASICLKCGHFLLGTHYDPAVNKSIGKNIMDVAAELKHNFFAIFTARDMGWDSVAQFYDEIFVTYAVGGLLPGVLLGFVAYSLTLPVIEAYQHRRRNMLAERFAANQTARAEKAAAAAADKGDQG